MYTVCITKVSMKHTKIIEYFLKFIFNQFCGVVSNNPIEQTQFELCITTFMRGEKTSKTIVACNVLGLCTLKRNSCYLVF